MLQQWPQPQEGNSSKEVLLLHELERPAPRSQGLPLSAAYSQHIINKSSGCSRSRSPPLTAASPCCLLRSSAARWRLTAVVDDQPLTRMMRWPPSSGCLGQLSRRGAGGILAGGISLYVYHCMQHSPLAPAATQGTGLRLPISSPCGLCANLCGRRSLSSRRRRRGASCSQTRAARCRC